jgi:hypothetical protein
MTAWISGSRPGSKMRVQARSVIRAPARRRSTSPRVRMFRLATALNTRSQPVAKWSTKTMRPRCRRTRLTSPSPAAWSAQW